MLLSSTTDVYKRQIFKYKKNSIESVATLDKAQHTLMRYYNGLGAVRDGVKENHFSACTGVPAHAQEKRVTLIRSVKMV